eukprot:16478-Heterococcus_DN1.PRE.1
MAFSKIIVAAIALMLASASAFMPAPSAALRATAVRSSAPHCSLRMSAGGDGSNPSHEEYVEKAKAWAAKNTHLSDAEIESSIKEGKHLVEQVYGSSHDVRKEGQWRAVQQSERAVQWLVTALLVIVLMHKRLFSQSVATTLCMLRISQDWAESKIEESMKKKEQQK